MLRPDATGLSTLAGGGGGGRDRIETVLIKRNRTDNHARRRHIERYAIVRGRGYLRYTDIIIMR